MLILGEKLGEEILRNSVFLLNNTKAAQKAKAIDFLK